MPVQKTHCSARFLFCRSRPRASPRKNPGKGHVDKESSSTGMTTFPLSSMKPHSPSFDTF